MRSTKLTLVILDLPTNFHIKSIFFVVNLLHLKELYLEHFINIDDVVATSVLSCLLIYKLWKLLV